MINNTDENFDDIDMNELFNDFDDKPQQSVTNYDFKIKTNQDDLTEFTENDCTTPRIHRKRTKSKKKKKNAKQMTMYDYASSISYKHKQFYSSLDNTITTKTITKGQKCPLIEDEHLPSISKNSKRIISEDLSSTSSPDFIDKLLQYLDERSRNTAEENKLFHSIGSFRNN